jgi:hypothetical protein
MRVKLLRDRDLVPPNEPRITVAYKKGWEGTVKREWGDILVADKNAEEVPAPPRDGKADARGG